MEKPEFEASASRSIRPVVGWERYKRVGITVALVLLLVGIPLIFLKIKSEYIAEAIFQIAPSYQKNMSADKDLELQSNSQYREFVNHLSRSVLRYDVLEHALESLAEQGIDPKFPSEDKRKWIERQQRTIYLLAIPDTYMVRVGIKSDNKEHLHEIVNAVINSFLRTTRNEQIYGSDQRGQVLVERSLVLKQEISGFEVRRSELAGTLGLTTFGENTSNPFDVILAQAREKLVLASIDRSKAQAVLAAFKKRKEVPASSGRSVLEMRLQDNGLQAIRNEVVKRNEELYRTAAGLQDSHPARNPALEEQAELKRRLQANESEFETSALDNTQSRFLASLDETRETERELAKRVKQLEGRASDFADAFREAMHWTAEIKKREQELADMRTRINYLETESDALGFVRLITPALPAITPQGLGKMKALLGLMTASLALMMMIPIVMDYLDSRVITVGDAEKCLQVRSAAWLVEARNSVTQILIRDQLRRFASTLRRNKSRGARNVFSFSSVTVGGGTTSMVLELARTLVELGSRTLVVNADSLTENSVLASDGLGLTDVLIGKATADSVISQQQHFGLQINVVPYGTATESGIKRLDVLKVAIDAWAKEFDFVLIDIPALLPSADAELLINEIGQVFLVVEAESVKKADVVRARHLLEKIDPDAVGLIVNRVPLENGGDSIKEQLVETVTGATSNRFMSTSQWSLRWNLFLLQVQKLGLRYKH